MKKPDHHPPRGLLRSWRDISQRAARRSLSPVVRRKRCVRGLGVLATLSLLAALGLLGAWAVGLYRQNPAGLRAAAPATPLARVDFQSDGVLTEQWARQYLGLQDGAPLLNYDVFALRTRLLASGQVREAFVERVPPDTLRLRLNERAPLLRVPLDDGAGGTRREIVAQDGTVYEGWLYADGVLARLPWLEGVTLHPAAGGGYAPVAGLDAVAALLKAARARLPELAAQWTTVDLSGYDPRPQAPLALIKVRTRNLGELVFSARDFNRELDRLAVVAESLRDQPTPPRRVNLSLDQQAVVELTAATPPPAVAARRATRP